MKGVILAAGRGSRLGPITSDRPKCLVEIEGDTLLNRQLRAFRAAGVQRVAVVRGWRAEAFDPIGLPTFENDSWPTTSMVESLACADAWLSAGTCVVSYGDIVYTADTMRRLARQDAPVAIAYDPDWLPLWRSRFADPLEDAETFALDSSEHVVEIGARPRTLEHVQGQYMGLLRITPTGWLELKRVMTERPGAADMTALLSRVVEAGRVPVRGVAATGPWFEFDNVADLELGRAVVADIDSRDNAATGGLPCPD